MKFLKAKSLFAFFLSLVFFASCGNPHLVDLKLDNKTLPIITAPIKGDLLPPSLSDLESDDSLVIITKNETETKTLQVFNPNPEEGLRLSFRLEREENFKARTKCGEELLSAEICELEITFSSQDIGVYKDNLIITYQSSKGESEAKNRVISLIGERQKADETRLREIILKTLQGDDALEVSGTDNKVSREIVAINPNTEEVEVSFSMENGTYFSLLAVNCQGKISARSSCRPQVNFEAAELGVYQDSVVATYKGKNSKTEKVIFPVKVKVLSSNTILDPELLAPNGLEGINIKTANEREVIRLTAKNPNLDRNLLIEYTLQTGASFFFAKKDCQDVLAAKGSCSPEITFKQQRDGIYKDNLIVTYYDVLDESVKYKKIIPLTVEKTSEDKINVELRIVATLGDGAIDFGKSLLGEVVSRKVKIKNTGDTQLSLGGMKVIGQEFRLDESKTCTDILYVGELCEITISFTSNKLGLSFEDLVVSYSTTRGKKISKAQIKLIGEKIESLEDCAGKLCSDPLELGRLELSGEDKIDFGTTDVATKAEIIIPVSNVGDTPVEVEEINLSGEAFSLENMCDAVIFPGECKLKITFYTLLEGSYEGLIQIKTKSGQILEKEIVGKAKATKECFEKSVHHVNALASADFNRMNLPYQVGVNKDGAQMFNLYGTKVNGHLKSINRYIVKNAQVVTSFSLPKLQGEIIGLEMKLNVTKVHLDIYMDTEKLCVSSDSVRKCSGQDFVLESFYSLKNNRFWDQFKKPVNGKYDRLLLGNVFRCGSYSCATLNDTVSMIDVLELSKQNLIDLKNDQTLNLILTDDTRNLSMPSLKITTQRKVDCK